MIPIRAFSGQKVGVLGLGKTGLSTARALEAGGAEPVCWDDTEATRAACPHPIEDLTRERIWGELAALIVSPGIPHLYPKPHKAVERAWAAGVPVDNDIGLFFGEMTDWEPGVDDEGETDPKIVCITGSNGKSTTSALLHHILRTNRKPTQLGGNIGVGVLDLSYPVSGEVIVLELSSYQTDLARRLAPDVAVFLNLSDDHLSRHGGRGGYFAAKARLLEIGAPERMVVGIDEPEGRFLADRMGTEARGLIRISAEHALKGDGWSVSRKKSFITEWKNGKQAGSIDLRNASALPGAHNAQNAAAAYASARMLGLGPRQIEEGITSFRGLQHRLERIADIDGVGYINDSKATNADAAAKALGAFERIRWIAGGQPKEGGLLGLLPSMGNVSHTYLIGEASAQFASELGERPHTECGTLERAVAAAHADAEPGDTVLLAPACASWDQFDSFEARGDAFRALVTALG